METRNSSFVRLLTSRPRSSLLAVGAFVVIAIVGGMGLPGLLQPGGFVPDDVESSRAVERIEDATGRSVGAGVVLLVDLDETAAGAADPAAATAGPAARLAVVEGVAGVIGPAQAPDLVSRDGTQALVVATLEADADERVVAEEVLDDFADEAAVTVGGSAVVDQQLSSTVGSDLARAELLAFPILALLSLLFFRGRATVLPLVIGITTVVGTFLLLRGVNAVMELSVFALNLVIGLGLGLAIDYSLFLLTRYREELRRHGPGDAAIAATMATAGRTVAFSAATVAVALVTLLLFPQRFLQSMGLAGAAVAMVAAAAALIISPIVFRLWGEKLARREPSGAGQVEDGRWARLSRSIMRGPGAVLAVTAIVMLGLAAPALRAEWTPVDASVIPTDASSRIVADTTEAEFATTGESVTLAVEAPESAAGEVEAYSSSAAELDGVAAAPRTAYLGADTWTIELPLAGAPDGAAAQRLVHDVRDLDAPFDVLVAGSAAEFIDQQDALSGALPLAISVMVLLTLLVLWLMTGSVLIPLLTILMNVLTVGAALGALTFIYQDGRLTGLLDYTPNGGVEPTNFVVAAVVVFALSTDYGVFLLGRIAEERRRRAATSVAEEREAVATGLQHTGAVVTAAAILLAVAIGAFSTSSISFLQQIGIATAFAVLLDAFVVRTFLVPALLGLAGRYAWMSPAWLRRLHDRFGLDEGEPVRPSVPATRAEWLTVES